MSSLPFDFPLSPDVIAERRAQILADLTGYDAGFAKTPVTSIRAVTLGRMLRLYDTLFFSSLLSRAFGELEVTISFRLTSAAGKFIYQRAPDKRMEHAEIRMSGDFLMRLTDGPFLLNGLSAATPQEAFLLVFEHELCHAAETALTGRTGHSANFKALALGLFGHTDTRHSLPTRRQEAAENGIVPGAAVRFAFEGGSLSGIVSHIGKRATVMVPDPRGDYRDRRGKRYARYYVPLSMLERLS